jgi:hypothetical protein
MVSKYRGKILKGPSQKGEWIFGDLKTKAATNGDFFIQKHSKDSYLEPEVDPSTVGQYVNAKDELNEELYPGDLLTSNQYPFNEGNYQIVIVWSKESITYTGLVIATKKGMKRIRGISEGNEIPLYELKDYKKIGNIFDNPELVTKQQLKIIKSMNKLDCYIKPFLKRMK